jgi:ribosomal protein S13
MSDIFGFEKAIKIDHLTDEQIDQLEKIFQDFQ